MRVTQVERPSANLARSKIAILRLALTEARRSVPVPRTALLMAAVMSTNPSDCPQADHFLDVASALQADENGLMPELSVECTDTEVRVTTNDIPHYTFLALTPNALVENCVTHVFPRYPEVADQPSRINEGFPATGSAGVTNTGLSLNATPHRRVLRRILTVTRSRQAS